MRQTVRDGVALWDDNHDIEEKPRVPEGRKTRHCVQGFTRFRCIELFHSTLSDREAAERNKPTDRSVCRTVRTSIRNLHISVIARGLWGSGAQASFIAESCRVKNKCFIFTTEVGGLDR